MVEIKRFQKGKRTYTRWGSQVKEVKVMSTDKKTGERILPPGEIRIDEPIAQGIYANLAYLTHTETEFIFDFIFNAPGQEKPKVLSRIISSPAHTKRFLFALKDNLDKYEQRFGPIKT